MDDLIAFLRARLDEDERIARATRQASPAWETRGGHRDDDPEFTMMAEVADAVNAGTVAAEVQPEDAEHIARHDPARVLADIAARRQIIERAQRVRQHEVNDAYPGAVLWAMVATNLEHVLRLLALPYAGHPDYRETWRP